MRWTGGCSRALHDPARTSGYVHERTNPDSAEASAGTRSAPTAQLPIKDHAVIGDCRTAALISREGSVVWLCLPNFSSPSVFGEILDERAGGTFQIRPRGESRISRAYIAGTPVLETTFETAQGAVRIVDMFPVAGVDPLQPMRELLRIVDGVSGELELEIRIAPAPNYGRTKPHLKRHGRLGWCFSWSNELLTVRSNRDLHRVADALHAFVRVRAGERLCLSLAYVKGDPGVLLPLGKIAAEHLDRTVAWWQGWAKGCTYAGPYEAAVLRSALTLKLLSFSLSGAVVAAPTTSLPEAIGAGRNWDYRYCWLRDSGWTMQALVGLGFHEEARQFLSWLLHATRLSRPELRIMYDVFGRTHLKERELEHFAGYRGSRPVRIGNGAHGQRQLDVYGEVVFAADAYVQGGGTLEPAECRMLKGLGEVVCRQWREPDHGIWEIRGKPRHYTFSKLMCWVALDRLLKLDEKGAVRLGKLRGKFEKERGEISEAIEKRGYSGAITSYTLEFDGESVDASLLLMPCLGFKDARDPRIRSTYDRIWQRLGCNGLLYRYERGHDDLPGKEGTFGICTFWAVHHLASRRDFDQAKRLFEHALTFANEVGLFAEEFDPENGSALGNFPQAFTHIGLINAALAMEQTGGGRTDV